MTTPSRLLSADRERESALRALSEAATPGPWEKLDTGSEGCSIVSTTARPAARIARLTFQPLERCQADAAFIIAAVNYVRAALSSPETTPAPGPDQAKEVWAEALARPSFKAALDEGLADLAAGRTTAWEEVRDRLTALSSPETNPAGVLDEAALREALEICVTELRRRERAAGKVISSPAVIFARSRLDGLRTTPEIEAAARSVLLAAAFGRSGSET